MFGIEQYRINLINHLYNSFLQKAVVENDKFPYGSAVAIIIKDGKVLLGKSKSKDERLGKYCFPGGGIDKDETVYEAVVREAEEEASVICEVSRGFIPIQDTTLKRVGFVRCNYVSGTPKPNWEFEDMKWFDIKNLPKDILERNKEIIKNI